MLLYNVNTHATVEVRHVIVTDQTNQRCFMKFKQRAPNTDAILPAEATGHIGIGDWLVAVNGVSITPGTSLRDAVRVLLYLIARVMFVVVVLCA